MAKIEKREMMGLTDWKYILTLGYSCDAYDVYGKDNKRVMVDRDTGQVILEYDASSTPNSPAELSTLL